MPQKPADKKTGKPNKIEKPIQCCKDDRAKELKLVFEQFDVDGDGNLSRQEMKEKLLGMGLNMKNDQIDAMIDECDQDGDGHINLKEFKTLIDGQRDQTGNLVSRDQKKAEPGHDSKKGKSATPTPKKKGFAALLGGGNEKEDPEKSLQQITEMLAACPDEKSKEACYFNYQREKFQAKYGSKAVQKFKAAVWKVGKTAKTMTVFDSNKQTKDKTMVKLNANQRRMSMLNVGEKPGAYCGFTSMLILNQQA